MDRVLFLNSNGGILSKYPHLHSEEPLPVAPYVEQVGIPQVSVDPAALYGENPADLARLTVSSGAALTFFCDSVAGGRDSSGNGSFDDPWRSLDTASKFLSCHAALLKKAAPYIQLKIRGTVDYVSSAWEPFGPYSDTAAYGAGQLILAGWGSRCDLAGHPSAYFAAGYLFGLRVIPRDSALIACSGCEVLRNYASSSLAVDCKFVSGADVYCACNCSADMQERIIWAAICHGGSYRTRLYVSHAYATNVNIRVSGSRFGGNALMVSSAAANLNVTVVNVGYSSCYARGIDCRASTCLRDCTVFVSAGGSMTHSGSSGTAWGHAALGDIAASTNIVTGGSWTAVATAQAVVNVPAGTSGSTYAAADASATGFGSAVMFAGVPTTLTASAGAVLNAPNGKEYEHEVIVNSGVTSWTSRSRAYSGGVATSTYSSSGSF